MACIFNLHSAADSLSLPGMWNCFEKNDKPCSLNFKKQPLILYSCDLRYSTRWKVHISLLWDFCVAVVWSDEGIAEGKMGRKGLLRRGRVDVDSEKGQFIFLFMVLSLGWQLGHTAETVG